MHEGIDAGDQRAAFAAEEPRAGEHYVWRLLAADRALRTDTAQLRPLSSADGRANLDRGAIL